MKVYKTSDPLGALALSQRFLEGEEGLIAGFNKHDILVLTGEYETFDREYCKEHGITVVQSIYHGGSIISFPGDLHMAYVHWGPSGFAIECIEWLVNWLKDKGLSPERVSNDVLVNGKKIAGYAVVSIPTGWYMDIVHFSIKSDAKVIDRICTKEPKKIPGQLSEFGITAEDIWSELIAAGIIKEE